MTNVLRRSKQARVLSVECLTKTNNGIHHYYCT